MSTWIFFTALSIAFYVAHITTQKVGLNKSDRRNYLHLRSFFMVVFLLPLLSYSSLSFSAWQVALSCALGLVSGLGTYLSVRAEQSLPLSVAQPIGNLQPLMTTTVAVLLLSEWPSQLGVFGISLLLLGVWLFELTERKGWRTGDLLGIGFMLASLVLFSVENVVAKWLIADMTLLTYFTLSWLTMNVAVFFATWPQQALGELLHDYPWYPLLAGVFLLALQASLYKAYTLQAVGVVSALFCFGRVVATLEGGFFLHDDNLWPRVGSCLVMASGAALLLLA